MSQSHLNILVVGAGAVGCFYASRLHHPEQNISVSLVCRSNYSVVAAQGVKLITRNFGDYVFKPTNTYANIPSAAKGTPSSGWDYVIVTTKALPDIVDDSEAISSLVTPRKTVIVLIQNGFGIEEPHRARFPDNVIVSAVTVISAEQISQGTVRQNKWTRISMGPYTDGQGISPTVKQAHDLGMQKTSELSDIFGKLGKIRDADVHTEQELQTIRWHKIAINAAFNPSAVLSGGLGNAAMGQEPEIRRHLIAVMYEVFDAAAKVLGKPLPSTVAKPELILKSTEGNPNGRPSMLVDWENSRPMELEVILGNPVRIARDRGADMPRLQTLYALLRSMQSERDRKRKEKANL